MKEYLTGFYYSLPVQLFLLHFRRYQILLIFWYILFATIAGYFMQPFGANSLYLAPEYLGKVSAISLAIVGVAIGIFIMSWNITTFILHSRHIKFLATTAQPFLKFCINNSVLPAIFLVFYFVYAIQYDLYQELISTSKILGLIGGFLGGFIFSVAICFSYFFSADKTIYRRMGTVIDSANKKYERAIKRKHLPIEKTEVRIDWFLSALFGIRKPRDVRHYSEDFLDSIFKRHHFAAVLAILLAFIFLIIIGYFSDSDVFQIPAAASITIFFAILIGVSGAIYLFFKSWSIPLVVLIYVIINWLYQQNIIDPRNKAYGLNYSNINERPSYNKDAITKTASPENIDADKVAFFQTLNKWKAKQNTDKPVAFFINVSGGGARSTAFTMNVLQQLDSVTNGMLMPHTILITGASGGMIGAAYFRALYWQKTKGDPINLHDKKYANDISKDLLNPLFSSFISRDIVGPSKHFDVNGYSYVKDRAYAFEQKLNENTRNLLNKKIEDYTAPESNAIIPLIFFNSAISRDGRKMIISTRPARFLMTAQFDSAHISPNTIDAIDYTSFFAKQNSSNLRVLSALRMNASFPYVLPNVWLPSNPVIDVLDAGLRDNFGQETALRFIEVFKDWLKENTSKIVLIQIRDRELGDWDRPYEPASILSLITKPFLLLQSNWFKLQDYYQTDELNYMYDSYGAQFYRISFQYVPTHSSGTASLSFHLTASEKKDIANTLTSSSNKKSFQKIVELLK
ncbi:MAG: patatin-like phospholipase family protein [Chitinophagaceae bacterium]